MVVVGVVLRPHYVVNNKIDPDPEKLRQLVDTNAVKSSTEAEADPAAVSEDVTEDTQSDPESHASPEHSGLKRALSRPRLRLYVGNIY